MFGGPGGGTDLDPLVALKDERKPLYSKLLAVPEYRTRYLQYVRDIAEQWLEWKRLQPLVAQYAALIDREVAAETRKLSTYEEFRASLGLDTTTKVSAEGGRRMEDLKTFVAKRREYLLAHAEIKKLPR